MDVSFDLYNTKGDHILVSLSNYDLTTIPAITDDARLQSLCFYDVSLVRKGGSGMVGYNILMRIASILADFLKENEGAVLCFYCDGVTELERHNKNIPPQQYRSMLFSKMFDLYIHKYRVEGIVNYPIVIAEKDPWKSQYAHFICRENHLEIIHALRDILISK
ncbi:MAG: hypothetical protein K2H96_10920 [Muribaculaceae bacterium]|nr:hypothetical protein [Muribaculaceae bacterium]